MTNGPPYPIRGVIFDCDGTLVDSEPISIKVLVEMLAELGHQEDHPSAVSRWSGRDLAEVFKEIEQEMGGPLPANFLDRFRVCQMARLEVEVSAVEGARELLAWMPLPFCVASNAPQSKVRLCLATSGLATYVPDDRIFSAYDVNAWKPKPDLFLHAAKGMGLSPENCAVVEDTEVGVEAALAAGMHTFAYDPHITMPQHQRVTKLKHLFELRDRL